MLFCSLFITVTDNYCKAEILDTSIGCIIDTDDAQADLVADTHVEVESLSIIDFIKENFWTLLFALLGFVEVIVRLTPTKKDDSILEWIYKLLSVIVPNNKSGGGKHIGK